MEILSLNCAAAEPLLTADGWVSSGIRKRAQSGPVAVRETGLAGDVQVDQRVHGGPAKAVYAYPSEHYPVWQTLRAQAGVPGADAGLPWGALGENLTLAGLLESQVWAGDRLQFEGGVLLQVTEPRQPCFKLAAALGFSQAVKMMAQSGYCGFYLSVLRGGSLHAGEPFSLLPGERVLSIPTLFRLAMRG
jgi:MOSC domain-containing protein YiiM